MASNKKDRPRRRYELKERARRQQETRRRITEAAVELHGTVGPARTTIAELARLAGVQRMTVYNHFATDADLFDACSSHWFLGHPPPDAAAWTAIEDPGVRLGVALREMYAYYRRNERMLGNVFRDAPLLPALGEILERKWSPAIGAMVDVLADDGPALAGADCRRATLRLVLDFATWRTLAGAGLDDEAAARLAARFVARAETDDA